MSVVHRGPPTPRGHGGLGSFGIKLSCGREIWLSEALRDEHCGKSVSLYGGSSSSWREWITWGCLDSSTRGVTCLYCLAVVASAV